jgi:hypothetical protein
MTFVFETVFRFSYKIIPYSPFILDYLSNNHNLHGYVKIKLSRVINYVIRHYAMKAHGGLEV